MEFEILTKQRSHEEIGDNNRDNNGYDDGDNDVNDDGDDDGDDGGNNDGDDGLCCMNGEVVLAPLQAPPPEIYYLLTEKDPISKVLFVDKIKVYNQVFAFTSIATDLDLDVANKKKRAYCYRIQGDHYHQISSALPKQEEIPKFFQIYFHDSSDIEAQINRRHNIMKQSLNREMISIIQNVLMDLNPFIDTYISAGNEDLQDSLYYILIHNKHGKDMRQYNTPSTKEVAAICFSDETMHVSNILIVRHNNELERISELHSIYNPLAYPLLFLSGEYALKKKMAQYPEASKISEAEAEASGTSNIDFGTLLERESQ
ncbi:23738_t:CDS:2, partial [Dentiscutata erythropus]